MWNDALDDLDKGRVSKTKPVIPCQRPRHLAPKGNEYYGNEKQDKQGRRVSQCACLPLWLSVPLICLFLCQSLTRTLSLCFCPYLYFSFLWRMVGLSVSLCHFLFRCVCLSVCLSVSLSLFRCPSPPPSFPLRPSLSVSVFLSRSGTLPDIFLHSSTVSEAFSVLCMLKHKTKEQTKRKEASMRFYPQNPVHVRNLTSHVLVSCWSLSALFREDKQQTCLEINQCWRSFRAKQVALSRNLHFLNHISNIIWIYVEDRVRPAVRSSCMAKTFQPFFLGICHAFWHHWLLPFYPIFTDLDLSQGTQVRHKAKPLGFIFSLSFPMIRMNFDVALKLF